VKEFNMERGTVIALREGKEVSGADPKELALIRFGRKVAADATTIAPEDIQALKGQGVDDGEIVEALSVVMLSALTNAFASALKIEQDVPPEVLEEYF
jgi:alkylhydroperoxidase family enzyme